MSLSLIRPVAHVVVSPQEASAVPTPTQEASAPPALIVVSSVPAQ